MLCLVELSEANFELHAVKNYDNPSCSGMAEFQDDMLRFKYLNRLMNKYEETGELRENLILNHLVVLFNLFGDATAKMLFYKVAESQWTALVPFLIFLNRMPQMIRMSESRTIVDSDIQIDMVVVDVLREIAKCKA